MKSIYLIQLPETFFLYNIALVMLKVYFISLFCTLLVTFLTNVQFFSPAINFVPEHLKNEQDIVHELKKYHYTAQFLICHGLCTMFSWLTFFLYYQSYYPFLFLSNRQYKIDQYLKQSYCLQRDKIDYFLNKVDINISEKQCDIVNSTSKSLSDFSWLINGLIEEEKTSIDGLTYLIISGLILLLIFLGLMLIKKKFQQIKLVPYILVIPSFNGLPGWLILKLVYPFIVVCLISYFLYSWRKSQKDLSLYIGQKLFPVSITNDQALKNLKMFRYYFVITFFGGNFVFVLNWVIFLSSFVSYRFSDVGVENLIEAKSEIPLLKNHIRKVVVDKDQDYWLNYVSQLELNYNEIIEKLQKLETTLQPYYDQQVDPIGELWWIPLIRLIFLLLVVGGFLISYYFKQKEIYMK